jgi:GNAT superfamily N-acetyltransferase
VTLSILGSDSGSDLTKAFLAVPREVYRDDPLYTPPARDSVLAALGRSEFRGAQRVFVALDGKTPVARLVARKSPKLEDERGRPYGMLGFFEALERHDVVRELFSRALDWLDRNGAGEVVGPMDGDTWHSYRLNVGPWDAPPFLMEPYNPPYYPALWEENGFAVLERYYSSRLDDLPRVLQSLEAKSVAVAEAGYTFQRLRLERFEYELGRFHELSCEIFRDNFLYSEISRQRFLELYRGARRLLDPELVFFAVAPDGSDAGFLFAFPDRFHAVAAMRGRRGSLAALRFLALRNRVDTVNLKSLGVVSAHRRSGLGAALMHEGYKKAAEKGYRGVNLCLILEGNPSGGLEGGLSRLLRRYCLYSWRGGDRR